MKPIDAQRELTRVDKRLRQLDRMQSAMPTRDVAAEAVALVRQMHPIRPSSPETTMALPYAPKKKPEAELPSPANPTPSAPPLVRAGAAIGQGAKQIGAGYMGFQRTAREVAAKGVDAALGLPKLAGNALLQVGAGAFGGANAQAPQMRYDTAQRGLASANKLVGSLMSPGTAPTSPITRASTAGYTGPGGANTYGVATTPTGVGSAPSLAATALAKPSAPAGPRAGDPNTFTGSNGIVRQIGAGGALTGVGSNQAGAPGGGTLQMQTGVPVAANGAPASFTRTMPTAAPAAGPGQNAYQADVARAQGRNLGTNARANQVSANSFFDPRHSNSEILRRYNNAMGDKQTASQRRGTTEMFGEIIKGVIGGSQTAQQGAENAIAQGNQTAGQLQLGEQAGQNRLAERALTNQGNLDVGAQQLNAPQEFTDAQGNAFVRSNTTLAPITGPDGKQARVPMSAQQGSVTPAIEYLGLKDQLLALTGPNEFPISAEKDPKGFAARQEQISAVRARMAALTGRSGPAEGAAPAPGTVKGGYRFKGGNPNDQANWEPLQSESLPTLPQFLARAKSQGSKMTDEQLRAAFAERYGP